MADGKVTKQASAVFVEGMGAAFASSRVLSELQGRIFGLLYLEPKSLTLDDIADTLDQSKSNVSINIRGLVDWHLVRRVTVAGSRRDHYEAATDFWRVMQEIMERRFRWNLRQVIATCDETQRTTADASSPRDKDRRFVEERLDVLRQFAAGVDGAIEAFSQGKAVSPDLMHAPDPKKRKRRPG